MGFSPVEVDRMSLWQFVTAWRGWRKANCPPPTGPKPPSSDQHAAAIAFAAQVS